MSDAPSREETRAIIDDKLEAAEARTGIKFAELKGEMVRMNDGLMKLSLEIEKNRSDVHNWMLAVIAVVVATGVGVAALLLASQANTLHALIAGISVGEHTTASGTK